MRWLDGEAAGLRPAPAQGTAATGTAGQQWRWQSSTLASLHHTTATTAQQPPPRRGVKQPL